MKLVKVLSTNVFKQIEESEFNSNPELYIDRTDSPIYWEKHYKELGISYFRMRVIVQELVDLRVNGFDDYRDSEKDVLGKMYIGETGQIIPFYMSYFSMSQTEASLFHNERVANNVVLKAESTRLIARSPKIISVGTKYLVWANSDGTLNTLQANNFTAAIQGFLSGYREFAYLGTNYGDDTDEIMDYIESTGSYATGGLKNYEFNPEIVSAFGGDSDLVRLSMASELKEIFVKGII